MDARVRAEMRAVVLPYVPCACGNACGQDLITGGEDIIFLDCAKEKLSHAHYHSELRIIIRRWIATHRCVRSHLPTCDVRAELRAECVRQRPRHRWRRYHLSRMCQRQAHVHCNSELYIIILSHFVFT